VADRGVTLVLDARPPRAAEIDLVLLDDRRVGHQSRRETVSIQLRISR
jgi:hypothetical protein